MAQLDETSTHAEPFHFQRQYPSHLFGSPVVVGGGGSHGSAVVVEPPGGGAQRVVARVEQSVPANPGGAHPQPPGIPLLQLPDMRTQTLWIGSQTHSQDPIQAGGGGGGGGGGGKQHPIVSVWHSGSPAGMPTGGQHEHCEPVQWFSIKCHAPNL